jgi:nucleoside-diphosphate-sugar epimerase
VSERALITGIFGFTGVRLARVLQAHGMDVYGIARASDEAGPTDFPLTVLIADLRNPLELRAALAKAEPDYVVHLAGISNVAHGDIEEQYLNNVVGTRNLLAEVASASHGVKQVVVASSANVYGNRQIETLTEDLTLHPVNDYGVSKVAVEYLANMFADRVPITIVRPFNYTGVGQSTAFLIPKIIDHFRKREPAIELGNIDVARDFSDVRDVCTIYQRLLGNPSAVRTTLNVCSGTAVSLREIIAMCSSITGHSIEVHVSPAFVRANEVRTLSGSTAKLESAIGTFHRIPLDETLRWMLED